MYYLAYGSNLQKERLENQQKNGERVGAVIVKGILKLDGHKLICNKLSIVDGSGKANIIPEENSEVFGVVYDLSNKQIKLLDRIEGGYERHEIPVRFENQVVETYFGQSDKVRDNLFPTEKYMNFIVDGAVEHGFPENYIQTLKEIPIKN